MSTVTSLHPRPSDATLTVTRAAMVLGVHPNTIRAWSEAGRLRYYRINPRGDRRYRLTDLQRFLAAAAEGPTADAPAPYAGSRVRQTRPFTRRGLRRLPDGPSTLRVANLPIRPVEAAVDAAAQGTAALTVMTGLARLAASVKSSPIELETLLGTAARVIREGAGLRHVSVWRVDGDRLEPLGTAGAAGVRMRSIPVRGSLQGTALVRKGPVWGSPEHGLETPVSGLPGRELACAIPGSGGPWGVLLAVAAYPAPERRSAGELLGAAAEMLGSFVQAVQTLADLDRRMHRAEALERVAGDIGNRLDLDQVLARLVDHAAVMFGADRAAVFLFEVDGSRRAAATRGLSAAYVAALQGIGRGLMAEAARAAGRPVYSTGFRNDPRAAAIRAAVVQEGFDTLCVAPLLDDNDQIVGSLSIYHDRPHHWADEELTTMAALAAQATAAINSARAYAQLTTWTAQLQSIQHLGAQLNRLSEVEEIGAAIATELHQLIDYHNVRVYRLVGDDLVPVAMQGQVGEYIDETPEQLRIKVGYGITGWVAVNRVAQNLGDAAADPRANTIPGTEPDLDESMLLAPMLFDDEVLGVVVLSKLGLYQFTDGDLRLLVIYASFAAQAMAHADANQRLRRQVQSQRVLLQISESILTTLDTGSVVETVTDRLAELVGWDNVAIELLDPERGALVPVIAKGVDADAYLAPWSPGETGLAPWVLEHNEPVLIHDQFEDARVFPLRGERVHGGLICVPLRGRHGAIGVLTLDRLGEGRFYSDEEFELVKLFAAQVSIAVQNAQAHGAIARQAETDDLTSLGNHRSFRRRLETSVAAGETFSLVMLDLDRFKHVNDTFGHEAGNDVLVRVAAAIGGASRETDAAFRYGGDEFVVILARTDSAHAGPIADRIRGAIAEIGGLSSGTPEREVRVDASAGVATFPADGATADEILLAADRACFVAKRSGGGRLARAEEGEALTREFTLQVPTPIDVGS